jgi:myo-inositol-1-phosphate synthase
MPGREGSAVGVMLVGLGGATASTTVAGAIAMGQGAVGESFGVTSAPAFSSLSLCSAADMRFGGWDFDPRDLADAVSRHRAVPADLQRQIADRMGELRPYPGVRTPLDIPSEETHRQAVAPASVAEGVELVCGHISDFRERTLVSDLVVIYLGSPHKPLRADVRVTGLEPRDLDSLPIAAVPAGLLYALGSIAAGAHFVDFTPSATLELDGLEEVAREHGVQLAGRDGSTGQTMLKLVLADLFKWRNLRLKAWYSTNLIGNHDGYVLSMPEHRELKLRDKTDGLPLVLGYDDFQHQVEINYLHDWGDEKESWDAIQLETWLGGRASLRLNWQGPDSLLAAPLILDLVRLLADGSSRGLSGLQSQLGFFFKRPLGRDGASPRELLDELVRSYCPEVLADVGAG